MNRIASRLVALTAALVLATGAAYAQQPSPSHLAAARAVVTSSGIVRSFDAILPQIFQQLRQTMATRPELTADLEKVIATITPQFERAKEEMVDVAAQVFVLQLSEEELKTIDAFFGSPAGKRYVETQPAVLDQMFSEMQEWSQVLSTVIINRVRAEMKVLGHEM